MCCVTPYPCTGPTLFPNNPRQVLCCAHTPCWIGHHSSGLNPSHTHPRPVARRSHHHLELHAAKHPSPFPAGWQSQRWEEALSFVHPGLHKGEKKAVSCQHVRAKVGALRGGASGVDIACHGLCTMGRGTVVREERCVGCERVNV